MLIKDIFPSLFFEKFPSKSTSEIILVQRNLLMRLTEEFLKIFKNRNEHYLKLLKNDVHKEYEMQDCNFLKFLIQDILSTQEYTLEGIAHYIHTPIDILLEIVSDLNANPSFILSLRIFKLHSEVRKELYNILIKKIICE